MEISTRRRASSCGSPTAPSNSGSRPRCRKPVPRCGTTESATGSAWAPTGTVRRVVVEWLEYRRHPRIRGCRDPRL